MTLTVLVAGSTVAMLRSATAARERVDRHALLQHEARAAVEALATALRNAHRPPLEAEPLEGIDGLRGGFPADRVRFFTVSRRPVRAEQPESDVRECEFFLHQKEAGALPSLMRRLDPTRNEPPDGGGVIQRIAGNVVGLDIEYLDAGEWLSDWPRSRRGWPAAIRVRITVMTPDPPRAAATLGRIVNFPYWPREDATAQGAGDANANR